VAPDSRDSHPTDSIDSETLFNRYARFVASFLYRQGARGADIEDLVQDVFLTAHRKGGYRVGVASPTTFLAHPRPRGQSEAAPRREPVAAIA
jgi:RNA polymerase sigma-70 factor (ECF subfamily)